MISVKNLVWKVEDVPAAWAFSNYTGIPLAQFEKGELSCLSPFKDGDTKPNSKPSFKLYFSGKKMKFKCFSTGKGGSHMDLVMELFNLSYHLACVKILNDYNSWIKAGGEMLELHLEEKDKFKVTDHQVRNWNTLDGDYWKNEGLGTKVLTWGLVKPLAHYKMTKDDQEIVLEGDYIYGYFNRADELVKVYQPKNSDVKFIKVKEYVPGSEHLMGNDFLIILSSWKDALTLISLGIKVDVRVPNSENSFFSEEEMKRFKAKYKIVLILFDNDEAGRRSSKKYKHLFNVDSVYITMDNIKDVTELRQKKGRVFSRDYFTILINKKLNGYYSQN